MKRFKLPHINFRIPKLEHYQTMKILHVIGSISRTLLALVFIFSGFVKAVDPLGTVYKIEDYLEAFSLAALEGGMNGLHSFFSFFIPGAGAMAVILIATELLLGITMLFNVRTRFTSWATLVFYLIMTPITLYIAIANPVSDCGCFGDAIVITNWQTFRKNVILLVLAIILVLCRKAIPQLFIWWVELCIALVALGTAAGIMGYSYTHLPIIDFRPYKVGNNIMELMEDGVAPKIDVFYTFEKEGELKEFLYGERPDLKGDSTWTFKYQETRILDPGKEPTITDFVLWNYDGDDMTYDILMEQEPVTLIIMYDLNKRDRKQADRAIELYKAKIANGELCYIVTGSTYDEIDAFAEENELGPEAFLMNDKTPLKTIVRANPGVVVLQNGVVKEKHNMKQL